MILLIGIVLGWVLGSRAAADAMAMEQRKRDERAQRKAAPPAESVDRGVVARDPSPGVYRPIISRCASASGSPASRMRAWVRSIGYCVR